MTGETRLRSGKSGRKPDRRPPSLSRHRSSLAVLIGMTIVAGVLLRPAVAGAQHRIELPIESALNTPRVELELTDARVVVTIDSTLPARFSARAADPGIDRDLSLEGEMAPRAVTRVRRNDSGNDLPTIVVEINLGTDQVLVVTGKRLDLSISLTDPTLESGAANELSTLEDEEAAKAAKAGDQGESEDPGPTISVSLEDSAFQAAGLRGLTLAATRSTIDLDSIIGPIEADLDESEAHARGLLGPINLHAVASEMTVEDAQGALAVDLEGGHLSATGGRLSLTCKASNAGIALVALGGSARLDGSDTSVRITDARIFAIQLTGTDLDIGLDDVGGPVNASLVSGRIQADTIAGRLDLQLAAGAEADLSNLESDLSITLNEGSSADLNHVAGHTRVALSDSDLKATGLKSIELTARGGSIDGEDIGRLVRVETDGSTSYFSLPEALGKHDIILKGPSTAVVQLPTPCRVVAKMSDTTAGEQLRVTGCLLDFDGAIKRGIPRGIDGRTLIRLNAELDSQATLQVDGLP